MTEPNFLVIGAGRSGTTSLHHYLRQHPQIYLPERKSPSFFYSLDARSPDDPVRRLEMRDMFVTDAADYAALFDGVTDERAVGEVSPAYLASTRVPGRIARQLPRARLVAILRDPIERLHSRFLARRRDGLEPTASLAALVERELARQLPRQDAAGTYVAAGFVSHVLDLYFAHFDAQQIRLYLYDDLVADRRALLRDLFEFLGVDPDVAIDLGRVHNRSSAEIAGPVRRLVWTRSATLRLHLRRYLPAGLRDRLFELLVGGDRPRPKLSAELRLRLAAVYAEEIGRLESRLGRDLSHWLEPGTETV